MTANRQRLPTQDITLSEQDKTLSGSGNFNTSSSPEDTAQHAPNKVGGSYNRIHAAVDFFKKYRKYFIVAGVILALAAVSVVIAATGGAGSPILPVVGEWAISSVLSGSISSIPAGAVGALLLAHTAVIGGALIGFATSLFGSLFNRCRQQPKQETKPAIIVPNANAVFSGAPPVAVVSVSSANQSLPSPETSNKHEARANRVVQIPVATVQTLPSEDTSGIVNEITKEEPSTPPGSPTLKRTA